jgi:hypothetical protein
MPGETALSNVRKYDFFAILGSGTYVVGSYWLLAAAVFNPGQKPSAYETLRWLSENVEKHWPVAVASLFLAFLIGNMLRALKVNGVDDLWKNWWFEGLRKRFKYPKNNDSPYIVVLLKGSFPYPEMLKAELKELNKSRPEKERLVLKENLQDLDFTLLSGEKEITHETWHSAYNFWKAELCRESAAAFEYTQELEGRVRLFATMFWASLLGLLAGVIGVLLGTASLLVSGWEMVMLFMAILSASICFIFGSQLRRVRGQEVAAVFLAYVSLILDRARKRTHPESESH